MNTGAKPAKKPPYKSKTVKGALTRFRRRKIDAPVASLRRKSVERIGKYINTGTVRMVARLLKEKIGADRQRREEINEVIQDTILWQAMKNLGVAFSFGSAEFKELWPQVLRRREQVARVGKDVLDDKYLGELENECIAIIGAKNYYEFSVYMYPDVKAALLKRAQQMIREEGKK